MLESYCIQVQSWQIQVTGIHIYVYKGYKCITSHRDGIKCGTTLLGLHTQDFNIHANHTAFGHTIKY